MLVATDATPVTKPQGAPRGEKVVRRGPEVHPVLPRLYAVEAELIEGVGAPDQPLRTDVIRIAKLATAPVVGIDLPGPLVPGDRQQPASGWAKVRVTYSSLPYGAVVDDRLGSADYGTFALDTVLASYVSRQIHPNVDSTQIGGAYFKWVPQAGTAETADQIGTESPVKTLPFAEVRYTWHYVPMIKGPPPEALGVGPASLLGRVNNAAFDGNSLLGQAFPVSTLLYLGCEVSDQYDHIGCPYPLRDLTYLFAYRPQGWNSLYRRAVRGFRLVTATGILIPQPNDDGLFPYDYGDFGKLWVVQSA